MKSADEMRTRIAQLRAAADALEWTLGTEGDSNGHGKIACIPTQKATTTGPTKVEDDVASALFNLGCGSRVRAEEAVRKATEQSPGADFEGLFRRALELVRPSAGRRGL